jgi:hypothetical protein
MNLYQRPNPSRETMTLSKKLLKIIYFTSNKSTLGSDPDLDQDLEKLFRS